MAKKRTRHTATTKARVAIEALRERKTLAQIASQYQVAPTQVGNWKKEAITRLPELFETTKKADNDELVDSLYEQIGRLQVELAWLKKRRPACRLKRDEPSWSSTAS